MFSIRHAASAALAIALLLAGPVASAPLTPPKLPVLGANGGSAIVAIVNGDVISQGDVVNRRRLFALSTGQGVAPEVLDRLTPQVIRQLVDEKLRLQEIQRRKIVVGDADIAEAIAEVEQRNGMPAGGLRRKLASDGVALRTLIDQIRVQIGWSRVLREVVGAQGPVSEADIKQQEAMLKSQIGQPEYQVGEIFISVADPAQSEDARRFAETVIEQLRAGAAFAVVAAQFSQSQTALQGGDLGWVQGSEVDPAVLRILNEMPPGAISNPIRVPGGYSIVTLRAKREIGRETSTVVTVRQVLFKFATRLDPAAPTDQQRKMVEQARGVAGTVNSCAGMEALAKAQGDPRGGDPGEIRLETVSVPAIRQVMATQPIGKPSQPLIAEDGVAVIMVCSREDRSAETPAPKELAARITNERFELASRQLIRDLQRRAVIDWRV